MITPVGNVGWDGVVFPLVAERVLVESLEDYLHLLFEEFFVGFVVDNRGAEGFDLSGMIAPAHAEDQPTSGHDVRHGEVLGQAKRMPHGHDVKGPTELESFG